MKRVLKVLFFVAFLAFTICCFSTNSYAAEQAYLLEEPSIEIDRDLKTIDIELRFQNLRSGMSDLGYELYISDDDYANMHSGLYTSSMCFFGSTFSCEMQRLAVSTTTISITDAPETRIYKAKGFTFEDYLSGQTVPIDGEIIFSLNDGIISNTIAIAPSTDVAASHTYLAENPELKINEDENTLSLPLSIVNRKEGIKSARIYLSRIPSNGPVLIATKKIEAVRDCTSEAACQSEYKKPLTLDINGWDANNGRYYAQMLIIEYPDGSMRMFDGQLKISPDTVLENTLGLELAADDVTDTDDNNPDTLDALPITIAVAIFSAIGLTGFISKNIFGHR